MTALKPCPFCGKSVTAVVSAAEMWPDDPEASDSSFAVFCDAQKPNGPGGCGASGGFFSSQIGAIAAWNQRATEAELLACLSSIVAEADGPGKPYSGDSYLPPDLVLRARAVITKATGEKPCA